ncbi:MAG: ATP-binding cassette domain-containing protein [Dehalococcoidia bacterium]|nr:ATP-binding cassette domain-containing protein [Dehalococcoidia bacterium]
MDYAVQTKGIAREFGDVKAVDGIDLNISRGEIYGFLGPNGAGKTTLVRMLITLLLPTRGGATVAGFDVVDQANDVRLRIGAALQEAALDPKQTGREILRLQGRLYGLSRRDVDTRFNELSSLVDIGDAIDRFVGTYSGGMRRRLDLAASLIHNPEILFLDEPTTGLDPISRARVWEEVRRINEEMDVTIFLTTQYLEEADALAGRVGIINNGLLMAEGTPAELKRSLGKDVIIARVDGQAELAREALVGLEVLDAVDVTGGEVIIQVTNGAAAISRVALALNYVGVEVSEITLRTPTLDDVFLSVAGERMDDAAEPDEVAAGAAD